MLLLMHEFCELRKLISNEYFIFQEEVLPDDVATEVAQNEKLIDGMPGVLIKGEDGSLKKIVTPGVQMPLPDFKPEPTR